MLNFYSDPSTLGTLKLPSKTAQSPVESQLVECNGCMRTALPKRDKTRISLAVETETQI